MSMCRAYSNACILYFDQVRRLESHGFTANQAEAITAVITDVLNDCLDSVGHSFVSKSDLQKVA